MNESTAQAREVEIDPELLKRLDGIITKAERVAAYLRYRIRNDHRNEKIRRKLQYRRKVAVGIKSFVKRMRQRYLDDADFVSFTKHDAEVFKVFKSDFEGVYMLARVTMTDFSLTPRNGIYRESFSDATRVFWAALKRL